MGFGDKMKEARQARGMTQKQLSDITGVATSSISSYEKRGIDPPWESACKIAEALDVTLDWLAEKKEVTFMTGTAGDIVRMFLYLKGRLGADCVVTPDDEYVDDDIFIDTLFCISDMNIAEFFHGYEKMLQSYESKIIDDEIFQLWIEKELKRLDKIEAMPRLTRHEGKIFYNICQACGVKKCAYLVRDEPDEA